MEASLERRIDGPMTSVSFSYLPDSDDSLVVYDHGGISPDPQSPNKYLVLVHFFIIPTNDPQFRRTELPETLEIDVPLSDFEFFGSGSWFKRQRHRGRSKLHKVTSFSNLKTHSLFDAFVDGPILKIYSEMGFGMDSRVHSTRGGLYLASKKGRKAVFKDSLEVLRFFVCGLSRYAEALIEQLTEETLGEPAYYENETGFDDNDTFVISPSPQFADTAVAVQLALILSASDLRIMFAGLGRVIKRSQVFGGNFVPQLIFPEHSKSLTATFRDTYPANDGSYSHTTQVTVPENRSMMIGQILSDNRDIPFKKLIIKSPNYRYEEEPSPNPDDNDIGKDTTIERLVKGKLSSNASNSVHRKRRAPNLYGITQAFPQLRKSKIRVERDVKKRFLAQGAGRTLERNKLHPDGEAEDNVPLSTGDGGFSGNAAPLIHQPKLRKRQNFGGKTFSPGARRSLFSPALPKSNLVEVPVPDVIKRDERCRCFVEATDDFKEHFSSKEIQLLSVKGFRCTGILSLGSTEPRWMVVAFLNVGSFSTVWIEPARIKKEKICLGIIARLDGNEIRSRGIRNILAHCGRRIQLRGKKRLSHEAFSGIWPTDFEFDDAFGQRLWHHPNRKNPYHLAEALHDVCRDIIDETEFA